jgi:Zn-dependent protease/predicted transcriptional regulator
MRGSLRLGKIRNIPVDLHFTLFVILPFFSYLFAFGWGELWGFPTGFGRLSTEDVPRIVLGVITALLLFLAILAHELAHCIVAQRFGWKVQGITLLIFGGLAEMDEPDQGNVGEGWMAFAGPAVSLALGGLFLLPYLLWSNGSSEFWYQSVMLISSVLGIYNIILGLFNLLPGFPMDGGRVLRAALQRKYSRERATGLAVDISKACAILVGVTGLLQFNLLLMGIGFFLYLAANIDEFPQQLPFRLSAMRVSDVMSRDVGTITPGMNAREAWDLMIRERGTVFPVVEGKNVVGLLTMQDLSKVPAEKMVTVNVFEIMSANVVGVAPDTKVLTALHQMSTLQTTRLVVLSEGRLIGMVSRVELVQAMDSVI